MIKRLNIFILPCLVLLCMACTEDLGEVPDRFEKVYGKELSSNGKSIILTEDGSYLIAGKTAVSAFDFTNLNGALDVGKVMEFSPSLTKVDASGNQLDLRLYPLSSLELHPLYERFEIESKGNLIDISENPDGSFYAIGEWRSVPFTLGAPWNLEEESNADNIFVFPFLMKLSAELNIMDVHSFNTVPDWDTVYNGGLVMKRFPDGDLGILISMTARQELFYPNGYRIIKIDPEGRRVIDKRIERFDGYKFARDFCFDDEGNIVLIGQRNKSIAIYRVPLDDMDDERLFFIDSDGVFGNSFNDNQMFIFPRNEGGFMSVYTNPRAEVVINILNSTFSSLKRLDLAPETLDEYPRAAIKTENGDFIIYTEYLGPELTSSMGYLYRINSEGERIFRMPVEGVPGRILEATDGDILLLSNPIYSGILPKTKLTKISADGTFD